MPKYVVSSTFTDPARNATVLGDDWPEEVTRLRKELDGDIVVYGSRRLSQALIEVGLADEVREQLRPWLTTRAEPAGRTAVLHHPRPTRGRPWSGAAVRTEFRSARRPRRRPAPVRGNSVTAFPGRSSRSLTGFA